MQGLFTTIRLALDILTMPVNGIAFAVGTILGSVLTPLAGRSGLHSAVPLVVVMPIASTLDPATGLILLGAMLAAGLATTVGAGQSGHSRRVFALPVIAMLVAAALVALSEPLSALIQGLSSTATVALLALAAALAVIRAHTLSFAAWRQTALLLPAGVALQLSPFALLDTANRSPMPLLLGLLVIGPALVSLVWPARHGRTWPTSGPEMRSGDDHADMPLSLLPAFLAGLPVTLIAALIALTLGESGLRLGPRLMTQRPKIVLGLLGAVVAASLLVVSVRWLAAHVRRPSWRLGLAPDLSERLIALLFVVLALAATWKAGTDAASLTMLAATAATSAIALYFSIDLAPLVLGLVIGHLMQPALAIASKAADGHPAAAVLEAPLALLLPSVAAIAAALAWPWLIGPVRARLTAPQ